MECHDNDRVLFHPKTSSWDCVGDEGTEERVLAFHTEKFAKEIDESVSVVVGAGMVSQDDVFPRQTAESNCSFVSLRPSDCEGWLHGEVLTRACDQKASKSWRPRHGRPFLEKFANAAVHGVYEVLKERSSGELGVTFVVALDALHVESLPARSNYLEHRHITTPAELFKPADASIRPHCDFSRSVLIFD